ncbi:MAG: hypothetical protein IV090_10085 [Candidatus Sericytochromatia bacterium]|nr:hypothetical protein [Candidatus Sericytochromatia bacterium]
MNIIISPEWRQLLLLSLESFKNSETLKLQTIQTIKELRASMPLQIFYEEIDNFFETDPDCKNRLASFIWIPSIHEHRYVIKASRDSHKNHRNPSLKGPDLF